MIHVWDSKLYYPISWSVQLVFPFRLACISCSSSQQLMANPPRLLLKVFILLWIWKSKSSPDFLTFPVNHPGPRAHLCRFQPVGQQNEAWGPRRTACFPPCPLVKRIAVVAHVPTAMGHFHRVSGRKSAWTTPMRWGSCHQWECTSQGDAPLSSIRHPSFLFFKNQNLPLYLYLKNNCRFFRTSTLHLIRLEYLPY